MGWQRVLVGEGIDVVVSSAPICIDNVDLFDCLWLASASSLLNIRFKSLHRIAIVAIDLMAMRLVSRLTRSSLRNPQYIHKLFRRLAVTLYVRYV